MKRIYYKEIDEEWDDGDINSEVWVCSKSLVIIN